MSTVSIQITNPSSSPFEICCKRRPIKVPGKTTAKDPVVVEVDEKNLEALVKKIERRFPYATVSPVEDVVTEEDTTEPETDPEKTADADTGTGSGGENTVPDRDTFFAGCKATKNDDESWTVTTADGKEIVIEGVPHHKQAKQAAYDQLYGEK